MAQHSYRIGIDIGGTFTDIVIARDDGLIETRKVPSTPDDYSRGIAEALAARLVAEYRDDAGPHHRHRPRHDRRDQRHPGIQGRAHRPSDDRGLSRRARDAPPAHSGALRPAIRQAEAAVPRGICGSRCASGSGRTAPCGCRSTRSDVVAAARSLPDARESRRSRSASCTPMPIPTHEIAAEAILRAELGDDVYICRGSEILPEIREYERTIDRRRERLYRSGGAQLCGRARRRGWPRSASPARSR